MKNNESNQDDNKILEDKLEEKVENNIEENVLGDEMSENRQQKSFRISKFLPNAVTITATCFGLSSIRFALNSEWEYAVLCIFISSLLDMFDGKVARLLRQSSPFGMQLDSLSDLVCFGVAPSIILYLISMNYVGKVGWAVCLFYTICCAMRLARFNVSHAPDIKISELEKKYFTGIPAPTGAILALFPMILFFETENYFFLTPPVVSVSLFLSGLLMVSTLKTISSKMLEIDRTNAWLAFTGMALIIICLTTTLWLTLSVLITIYIISIPAGTYMYTQALKQETN